MRILFTIIDANLVGGQHVALGLMEKLRSCGAKLFAAFPGTGPLEGAVRQLGVEIERIPSWRLRDPRGYLALARVVARTQPDLIYTHCSGGGEFIGAVIGKLRGIPVVIHRHSFPALTGTRLRRALERILMKWAYTSASAVIAVSDVTCQRFADLGVPLAHVKVIKNGVPLDKFAPSSSNARALVRKELGLEDDSVVVSLIGRLGEIKGQRVLLEAARKLPCAELKLRFLIVGKDLEQEGRYEAYLKRLARAYELSDRVVFTGHRDQIGDLLAASDVSVVPSRQEPFGLVIVESMAAKKPVIATATTGAREIIEDGVTGLLVPIDDPTALAQALLRLIQDPYLCATLTANAYTHAATEFSDVVLFQKVMRTLCDAMRQRANLEKHAIA